MPFKNNSEDFALGFECGQIWEMLNHCTKISGKYVHEENKEQIERICQRFHAKYSLEECYEGWLILDAEIDLKKAN